MVKLDGDRTICALASGFLLASGSRWQTLVVAFLAVALQTQPLASFAQEEGGKSNVLGEENSDRLLMKLIRGRVVDEAGETVAGATVETLSFGEQESFKTTTLHNGAFLLRVPAEGYYGQSLLITDSDGKRASFISGFEYTTDDRPVFTVILRPLRTTKVEVVDEHDRSVSGAIVMLQANYQALANAITDQHGQAEMRFPADAQVDWINAYKDGAGYDYFENYDSFPTTERLVVPDKIKLQLQGAVPVEVQVTDSTGQPIAGVKVGPWTIKTKGKLSYANVGGVLAQSTDQQGIVSFPYIPRNLERVLTFGLHSTDYFCATWPTYDPSQPPAMPLKASVMELPTVRGRVVGPDGNPAAGIKIQGEGRGATNNYFRGYTVSKFDGSYEFKIYPNQNTILAVTSQFYAANVTGLDLAEGQERNNVDLVLTEGTRIHGRLTVGDEQRPAVAQTATLIQEDGNANLVRWNETDQDGHYEFRVAAGSYSLRLGAGDPIQLQVKDEIEFVHDAKLARLPRGTLSGVAVGGDGEIVEDVVVVGESTNAAGHAGFKAKAQANGHFSTDRWRDDMQLYAFSAKANLACQESILADDATVELKLLPAAVVRGKVLDPRDQPVVNASVQLTLVGNRGRHLNREVTTNETGEFSFAGVLPQASWRVSATFDGNVSNSETIKVETPKRYELEPLVLEVSE